MRAGDAIEALVRFAEAIGNAEKESVIIENAIQDADMQQQDLLHRLEFDTFNASEGYQLAKKLQEVRRLRRELKNDQELLKPLRDFADKQRMLRDAVLQTVLRIQGVQQTQQARVYSLRNEAGVVK
jgi:Mg2+ and Co2+ transporter CorA